MGRQAALSRIIRSIILLGGSIGIVLVSQSPPLRPSSLEIPETDLQHRRKATQNARLVL